METIVFTFTLPDAFSLVERAQRSVAETWHRTGKPFPKFLWICGSDAQIAAARAFVAESAFYRARPDCVPDFLNNGHANTFPGTRINALNALRNVATRIFYRRTPPPRVAIKIDAGTIMLRPEAFTAAAESSHLIGTACDNAIGGQPICSMRGEVFAITRTAAGHLITHDTEDQRKITATLAHGHEPAPWAFLSEYKKFLSPTFFGEKSALNCDGNALPSDDALAADGLVWLSDRAGTAVSPDLRELKHLKFFNADSKPENELPTSPLKFAVVQHTFSQDFGVAARGIYAIAKTWRKTRHPSPAFFWSVDARDVAPAQAFIADNAFFKNNPAFAPALVSRTFDVGGHLNGASACVGMREVLREIQHRAAPDFVLKLDSDAILLRPEKFTAAAELGLDLYGASQGPHKVHYSAEFPQERGQPDEIFNMVWGPAYTLSARAVERILSTPDKELERLAWLCSGHEDCVFSARCKDTRAGERALTRGTLTAREVISIFKSDEDVARVAGRVFVCDNPRKQDKQFFADDGSNLDKFLNA